MSMREKIADVLARVPVRDGVHPGGELDKARRFDAADAILNILNEYVEEPTPEMVEAACEARNLVTGTAWTDGTTEGVQAVERMLAERMIRAVFGTLS